MVVIELFAPDVPGSPGAHGGPNPWAISSLLPAPILERLDVHGHIVNLAVGVWLQCCSAGSCLSHFSTVHKRPKACMQKPLSRERQRHAQLMITVQIKTRRCTHNVPSCRLNFAGSQTN